MATLGQITQKVSERLLDPLNIAIPVSSVVASINDAVAYWKVKRFWFNEVSDTAQLTEQDPSFPYPADFLAPSVKDGGFVIEYSNMRYNLTKIDMVTYNGLFLENGYGIPLWYARIADNEYQCYPIPDRDYIVRRNYLKDFAPLVNSEDENDFTIHAARLIELWACADLSAELRQDDKMASYFRGRAEEEKQNIIDLTTTMNASGHIFIDSNLM